MVSKPAAGVLRLIRPDILAMLGYEPIEPAGLLAEQLGIAPADVAKLDGNENPYGPSPRVVEALAKFDGYNRYPDPQQRALREALAGYTGVGAEHIIAGHGSDELIDLLLRAVLSPGEAVIDCPPTFGMYGFSTRVCGGVIVNAPRRDDFSIDIDAVRAARDGANVIFVASPNNPTGNRLTRAELDGLLALDLIVAVDEAYIEFAGESWAALVPQCENLVVLRTFSKWAGLAGLRAGFALMSNALNDVLMQMKPPYTPNVAAEVAMVASLDDRDGLMRNVQKLVEERERLRRQLETLEWLQVYPSEGNFLLVRITGTDGRDVRDALARKGLFVRYFDTSQLRDCIRISVGLPEHTDRVYEALREQGGNRAR